MPVSSAVLDRARFVRSYGLLSVYHYDYPTLVLAKIVRATERDLADVEILVREGIVSWVDVEPRWDEVRTRETVWLRHTPPEVERRLAVARSHLRAAGLLADIEL
jgi:hypothetical protein